MVGESHGGAERSTAIVLFTDLVGSTELRSRLGDDAAEALRRTHDGLIADAVEGHRGRLVKHLGDGVMATFAGASDALGAAVAIQQALNRHNRSGASGVPLEARIGASAGDVVFEEADCFGTPVIEAARLCAAAGGGQILVSEIVRLLAGTAGGHRCTPVGALDLKGLPAPVSACEVVWEPLARSSVPLPALLTEMGRVFVGREAQLERVAQLWKEAAAGERRVALLAGEPGVGKTRLAAELAARVHDEGATVLAGRCDEDLGVPYQPLVEALRQFIDHTPPRDLPGRLGRYGGELVRLVPEVADAVPGLPAPLRSDPETERYRLFDAVAAWLATASAEEPLLLVLDDLQWAAKPTLLMVRHVVRSPDVKRLLVLGTYRDTELGHDHPLVEVLADLRRQGGVQRISLTGLDSSGVAAFLEQAAGHPLGEEDLALARAIHEETEGNPFFVREVLRHLAETGAIERREGRWAARLPVEELGIPEGVREVVGRRLSRLSPAANEMLRVAAVLGAEFELSLLQVAAELDEKALLSALEEAIESRLIREVPGPTTGHRFAHALVRDTLYHELSAARRVALHRRAAEAIEGVYAAQLDDHLPALAHHWARASAPTAETGKAVEYATRAGDRALAQFANDEAVGFYRQALELLAAAHEPETSARRIELLLALGEAQRRAGDPAHRQTLLDVAALARARGDADALARSALANSRGIAYSRVGELDHERIEVLQAALEAVAERDLAVRARLMANLAVELVFSDDRERRVALSDAALAAARESGDDAVLAHVLMARYYTILAPNTLSERLANTSELIAVTERLADPFLAAMSLYLRTRAAIETADVDEADRCLEVIAGLTDEVGQPFLRWFLNWTRAGRELLAGRLDDADRFADRGFEIGRASGQPEALLAMALERFQARFEQGRFQEARDALDQAVPEGLRLPLADSLRALLACELGQDETARTLLAPLASGDFSGVQFNNLWLTTMANAAAVSARLGETDWAECLYALLNPYAAQLPLSLGVAYGSVAHYLGLLATTLVRFAEAEHHFIFAATLHDRIAAPVWLARTRLEWAAMLLTRRGAADAERARELVGQTLATARQLGLATIERRAVALLADRS